MLAAIIVERSLGERVTVGARVTPFIAVNLSDLQQGQAWIRSRLDFKFPAHFIEISQNWLWDHNSESAIHIFSRLLSEFEPCNTKERYAVDHRRTYNLSNLRAVVNLVERSFRHATALRRLVCRPLSPVLLSFIRIERLSLRRAGKSVFATSIPFSVMLYLTQITRISSIFFRVRT